MKMPKINGFYLLATERSYYNGSWTSYSNVAAVCLGQLSESEARYIFNNIVCSTVKEWHDEWYEQDERYINTSGSDCSFENHSAIEERIFQCSFTEYDPNVAEGHETTYQLYHPNSPSYNEKILVLVQLDESYRVHKLGKCQTILQKNSFNAKNCDELLAKTLGAAEHLIGMRNIFDASETET